MFEEGLGHRTLPDDRSGPAVDLLEEVFSTPADDESGPQPEDTPMTQTVNKVPTPQPIAPGRDTRADTPSTTPANAKPRRSAWLAAAPKPTVDPAPPPTDNSSDPESEEETFAPHMPGALSTQTLRNEET
ncbi:hypothetical protein C0992_001040, partial [Termitomyces sp. T32_za158]